MNAALLGELVALGAEVEALRDDGLTSWESDQLDVVAWGWERSRERRAEAACRAREYRALADFARDFREPSLIASMSAPDAAVQPWTGIVGAEGHLTGDGRLIGHDALTWAEFPLPLRYAPADFGGHEGAVLVGRIDAVWRGPDGLIYARGVIDLGSEIGREVARLIRGGMLSGVSLDLDSSVYESATLAGEAATVISSGRVRAATLVSIPAFDVARIALVDDPTHAPDCGCDAVAEPSSLILTAPR